MSHHPFDQLRANIGPASRVRIEELTRLHAQAVQDAILVQQAESRYAGLKAGVEQVIAEMRRFQDHGWADALASLLETPTP